jgi:hypothetical protein
MCGKKQEHLSVFQDNIVRRVFVPQQNEVTKRNYVKQLNVPWLLLSFIHYCYNNKMNEMRHVECTREFKNGSNCTSDTFQINIFLVTSNHVFKIFL